MAKNPFSSEADLCAAFIAAVGDKWTAYAETGGYDILLVHKADGRQVGVQAKLKLNVEVINQAIEDGSWYRAAAEHADYIAILVPDLGVGAWDKVCHALGVTVVRVRQREVPKRNTWGTGHSNAATFSPNLPTDAKDPYTCRHWHEAGTVKRHSLPEYVPDVVAGAPAPLQLTDWKIKAIKLAVTLEMRGHLTRRDFAYHHVDHRRWVTQGWLKVEDGRYVKDAFPNFKKQHPIVYKLIKSDAPKWLPKTLFGREPQQGAML